MYIFNCLEEVSRPLFPVLLRSCKAKTGTGLINFPRATTICTFFFPRRLEPHSCKPVLIFLRLSSKYVKKIHVFCTAIRKYIFLVFQWRKRLGCSAPNSALHRLNWNLLFVKKCEKKTTELKNIYKMICGYCTGPITPKKEQFQQIVFHAERELYTSHNIRGKNPRKE